MFIRKSVFRKSTLKPNDPDKTDIDPFDSKQFCPFYTTFLMESTSNSTEYINIYKDAVNQRAEDRDLNIIIIDHNQLVDSLRSKYVENTGTYRIFHEKARYQLINDGHVSTSLMVQLVQYSIFNALNSIHKKWDLYANEKHAARPEIINVILINFFNLAFVRGLIETKIKTVAIVELSCRKIAQLREKFVSTASEEYQIIVDETIWKFWRDLDNELNTINGSCAFKDIIVHSHQSKYDAQFEPLDSDKIVAITRKYVMNEISNILGFIFNVRTDYTTYIKNVWPAYALVDVYDNYTDYYKSYSEQLTEYPEEIMTVAVLLDAMIKAISKRPIAFEFVDARIDALRNDNDDGCMNYPICVQYGNECALTERKHDLRFTNYANSTVVVLNTKWKQRLWGSRPLTSLNTEAKHDRIISNIQRQCLDDDDVDMKLCVLALNRLRINLDVFRGEIIDWTTLKITKMTYVPKFIEPVGCTTLVQILEKASGNYGGMSYAHFEPEDVMLVCFYDTQESAQTQRRSSFGVTVAQQPVNTKDYFDYIYGKSEPKRFYAIDAMGLFTDYREETENVCFKNGDRLSVAKRKWKYEPETVCLKYKFKSWEIIKHITDGGYEHDQFRIYGSADQVEYCIEKYRDSVMRLTCKTWNDDGLNIVEIVSGIGPANYVLRQLKSSRGQKEASRTYGNGRVVIKMSDKTTVTYLSTGLVKSDSVKKSIQRLSSSQKESKDDTSRRMKVSESKSRVSRSSRSRRNSMTLSSNTSLKALAKQNEKSKTASDICNYEKWLEFTTDYSSDGTTRTVKFTDGTTMSTSVQEVPDEPGWVCFVVSEYKYTHPAYRNVEEKSNGEFLVSDLVSRSSPDGGLRLRLGHDSGWMEFNHDVVVGMYRDGDNTAATAKFGWQDSGLLFEKRGDRAENVTTVTYDHVADASVHRRRRVVVTKYDEQTVGRGNTITTGVAGSSTACFVVKRGMSGFRMLDGGQYNKFADKIRHRTCTVVHENRNEIVALFAENDTKTPPSFVYPTNARYRWFNVSFTDKHYLEDRDHVNVFNLRLISRAFRKSDADYSRISKAIRKIDGGDNDDDDTGDAARRYVARLVVRVNVPTMDTVLAMFASGSTFREYSITNFADASSNTKTTTNLTAILARHREHKEFVLEARTRTKRNDFLPYFHCYRYDTLKNRLVAAGLLLVEPEHTV